MELLLASSTGDNTAPTPGVLRLANDADPTTCSLEGVSRVELHFPTFADGRAYSQAVLLRRRLGFQGDIRAVGDVLIDQVQQMSRTGFTSAELRADQSLTQAREQLKRFDDFYQGDALQSRPRFARI
ncbi:MAG: DUF934 domain-containing protein [Limnohabitans sp.]|jgi:uncharacterized protein (DUF934 family)